MGYNPKLGGDLRDAQRGDAAPVRVFVVANDALAGDGVRASLRDDARLQSVSSASEAEVIVWDLGATSEVVADAHPLLGGVRAGRQALLMLVPSEAAAAQALQLGALGVLQRRSHASTLASAIIAVRLGLCVLDADFAERYLELPKSMASELEAGASRDATDALEPLTAREREVLEALALGLSNRAIARRLGVSVHTVKFHVNGIFAKLQVDNRAGAVAKALRRGLVRV